MYVRVQLVAMQLKFDSYTGLLCTHTYYSTRHISYTPSKISQDWPGLGDLGGASGVAPLWWPLGGTVVGFGLCGTYRRMSAPLKFTVRRSRKVTTR